MATAFRRTSGGLRGRLSAHELAVVVHTLREVRDLVAPEQEDTGDPLLDLVTALDAGDDAGQAPQDPALLRLLPVAHRSDEEHAREFRALTQHSLRRRKATTLDDAIAALTSQGPGRVELDEQQAGALMVGLTDVRLVLGERLDLRTDEDATAMYGQVEEATGERAQQIALYDFLTWLQESLAGSLVGD